MAHFSFSVPVPALPAKQKAEIFQLHFITLIHIWVSSTTICGISTGDQGMHLFDAALLLQSAKLIRNRSVKNRSVSVEGWAETADMAEAPTPNTMLDNRAPLAPR